MSSTSLFRAEVLSVDDTGDIQTVNVLGHANEQLEGVLHLQPHGFSTNPPVGSHGIGLRLRGESDLAVMLAFQDPKSRPKKLPSGERAFYNAGSVMLQTSVDDLNLSQKGTFTLTIKSLVLKCGGVTVTIDGNGLAVTGGKVTHNDHDIGATHQHTNTQPGNGLSGVPQ